MQERRIYKESWSSHSALPEVQLKRDDPNIVLEVQLCVVSGGRLLGLDVRAQCRVGVTPSVSLIFVAGGATTRWRVGWRTSLLQRTRRSTAFQVIGVGGQEQDEWMKMNRVKQVGNVSCEGSGPLCVHQP